MKGHWRDTVVTITNTELSNKKMMEVVSALLFIAEVGSVYEVIALGPMQNTYTYT